MSTPNKKTVETYMDGFRETNHEKILSCLTDDITWDMHGYFHHSGKEAFDREIENDLFVGKPTIQIIRMVEEDNIVVAEGTVQAQMKSGDVLDALFCDVFHMENGKIKKLSTYQMNRSK
jgi:ketosteroid isomerase-like protein